MAECMCNFSTGRGWGRRTASWAQPGQFSNLVGPCLKIKKKLKFMKWNSSPYELYCIFKIYCICDCHIIVLYLDVPQSLIRSLVGLWGSDWIMGVRHSHWISPDLESGTWLEEVVTAGVAWTCPSPVLLPPWSLSASYPSCHELFPFCHAALPWSQPKLLSTMSQNKPFLT